MPDSNEEHDDESGVRELAGGSIDALIDDPMQQHVVHLLAGRLIGPAHGRSWADVRDELRAILARGDAAGAAG
jgi:hypothetical protein